jgi:hypothetical protein
MEIPVVLVFPTTSETTRTNPVLSVNVLLNMRSSEVDQPVITHGSLSVRETTTTPLVALFGE